LGREFRLSRRVEKIILAQNTASMIKRTQVKFLLSRRDGRICCHEGPWKQTDNVQTRRAVHSKPYKNCSEKKQKEERWREKEMG